MNAEAKKWGKGEYWGLSSDYDQDWVLSDEQKTLRNKLIEVCRTKIRPYAIHCDKTYEFPRKSMDALAELGLLGVCVPKELGGLGQNHVGITMVVETLARYGCPSTALVYTMHVSACILLILCYNDIPKIKDLLVHLNTKRLIGTIATSDPATGNHFWFPLSSKVKKINEKTIQVLKHCSWVTSAAYADWYAVETLSPEFNGNYSSLSLFLFYKDEVRASNCEWSALGMHGNQSGPLIIEGKFDLDRMIYTSDKVPKVMEVLVKQFLLLITAVHNGISLACMDVAKRHVTRKTHADVGMRVCDYPTIQEYFGDCISSTNICRSHAFLLAQALDTTTDNMNWILYSDLECMPRDSYEMWLWNSKYASTKNASEVSTTMLHACGGSGYKTDLGLERLFRDAQAGWVMSPSNEVIKQFLGKSLLLGGNSLDLWEQKPNERVLQHELGKLDIDGKKELAKKLTEEIKQAETGIQSPDTYQDTDFENPFNTSKPTHNNKVVVSSDGMSHVPCLTPSSFQPLQLLTKHDFGNNMSKFVFGLKNRSDHTGCVAGQFIQIRVNMDGKFHERYFSPISRPDDFGKIEILLKFVSQGNISDFLTNLRLGDFVDFIGPCGGFEYEINKVDELTFLASGGGVTPALQLIRCIVNNPLDKTKINLIYYSETVEDILLREELENYAVTNPSMRILFTLGEAPEDWEGEEGFISTEIIEKYVTKPNENKHKIVMCGGSSMAISCLYSLRSLKFPPEMIYIYGQLGVEFVRKVYGRNVKLSGHKCSFELD